MKTGILMMFLSFLPYVGTSENPDLEKARKLYLNAATEENSCRQLIDYLSTRKNKQVVFQAYYGSAYMMMAKHVHNPFNKLEYFNEGREILENAIQEEPKNTEAVVLRYLVQSKIPAFLGYKNNMEEDKKFILSSLSKFEQGEGKKYLFYLLGKSGNLTDQELKSINN